MVHKGPAGGMRAVAQQYPAPAATQVQHTPTPRHAAPAISAPALTGASLPTAAAAAYQVQAVAPLPGRLVLLGPLRMIRSQCVAKIDLLRPILTWLDTYMGGELRTLVFADTVISNIVYAVNIPMDDER
ncbi:hypothetical protein E8E11_003447 [Didymella keratinophila]|nr:hypothetical protein E8E11_003447 [Didymella keratinophila]